MPRQLLLLTSVLLLILVSGPDVGLLADAPPLDNAPSETTAVVSPDPQAAALAFLKEHHPQLNSLIGRLKKRDPAEYDKALSDVFKTSDRLQRLQSRDPRRYEVDLNLWKVDSRIRLLAARMAGDERDSLEHQLRKLLNDRTELKLQQLALERERLTNRVEKLDAQVRQLSSEREATIDKEIERLHKSVRSRTSSVSKKPAASTKDKPSKGKASKVKAPAQSSPPPKNESPLPPT